VSPTYIPQLFSFEQLQNMLSLGEAQIRWLCNTGQLQPIRICGEERFESRDVQVLIAMYKQTQSRWKAQ
jgi:hypothetical protein